MPVKIIIEDKPIQYLPQEIVTGCVEINELESKKVTKVVLHSRGDTIVKWNIHDGHNPNAEKKAFIPDNKKAASITANTNIYGSEILHFNNTLTLNELKEKRKSQNCKTYPFSFHLPKDIPSSIECKFGRTRYYIEAEVFYGAKKSECSQKHDLPVCSFVDLNELTDVDRPLEIFCQAALSTNILERLVVLVRAPVCGFVPGQVVPFNIQAINSTQFDVTNIYLQIIRRTHFLSETPERDTRKVDTVMKEWMCGAVEQCCRKSWTYPIVIPRLIPSGFNTCRILDIDYYVKLIFKVPSAGQDIKLIHQVVIAVIPFFVQSKPAYAIE